MATGRTISASFLTDLDHKIIELCDSISKTIYGSIPDEEAKKEFKKEYGKISYTRDGGLGLGGGKIQRDAICTRGRQGKAPFSNRNLRWHPLIVAENKPDFARKIERIEIGGQGDGQILIFVILLFILLYNSYIYIYRNGLQLFHYLFQINLKSLMYLV